MQRMADDECYLVPSQSRSRSEQDLMQSPMLTASRSSGAIIQNTASRAGMYSLIYGIYHVHANLTPTQQKNDSLSRIVSSLL